MSDGNEEDVVIAAKNLTKTYKLYGNVTDQAIDLLGLSRFLVWRSIKYNLFTALNNIDLTVRRGERIGVIGRNGAGKTTLLKTITGSAQPTTGTIEVNGEIQALMDIGLGFHPEFTGRENIDAGLLYNGLFGQERVAAAEEIYDFCELAEFLDQPVKTYSLGMKSRLQFACATAVKPDILVIDEIMGAGDAYFSAKSSARMQALTNSGCTLLLVSHSMGQIIQFCDRAIWVEGGKIVAEGEARDIVIRYEKFIHELRKKSKLMDADKLVTANKSAWLQKKTLEALSAAAPVHDHGGDGEQQANGNESSKFTRWAQEDSPIRITATTIMDGVGERTDLLRVGEPMSIEIEIEALCEGRFPCRYVVVIFSSEAKTLVRQVSDWYTHNMKTGEKRRAQLHFETLHLGTGDYFFSVAVYKELDLINLNSADWYDLYSRAFDFRVAEDMIDSVSLFHHPAKWVLTEGPEAEKASQEAEDVSGQITTLN